MSAGEQIRTLRGQRGLRPSDIERLSQRLANECGNPEYLIPHGTLHGIESGSIPTVFKLASLASILRIPIDELLVVYGINDSERVSPRHAARDLTVSETIHADGVHTVLDEFFAETRLLQEDTPMREILPPGIRSRLGNSHRFSYGIVGLNDDLLCEVLPRGSFVEIDTEQRTIARFEWTSLSERPIYFLWHDEGHVCCWCDQTGNTITILPHPLSRRASKRLRVPRDVTVIGRITNYWRFLRSGDDVNHAIDN